MQIRKLTEMVGCQFEQVGCRMYLTDAGRHLYDGCHELFQALSSDRGRDRQPCARSNADTAWLGRVSATAFPALRRWIGAFIERHPGIRAVMSVHNRATLVGRLKQNADDLYLLSVADRARGTSWPRRCWRTR